MNEWEKRIRKQRPLKGYEANPGYNGMQHRISLQVLGGLIRDGNEFSKIYPYPLKEREAQALALLEQQILQACGEGKTEEILDCVMEYAGEIEQINFDMGIKVGAALYAQLTGSLETDW